MPKKPSYSLHKASGQARVRIDGVDHNVGPFNSEKSRAKYNDLITDWLARQDDPTGLSIADLSLLYLAHARRHYRKNGVETSEVNCVKQALRYLVTAHGELLCRNFGPKALKKVRDKMIEAGLCRNVINKHVSRLRRMFKWSVSEELVPVSVHQRLCTLPGLEAGRSATRESEPVRPVANALIDAVKPFFSRQIWGMIQLQLATGMRPGEVIQIRGIDLNTTGAIWEYVPTSHKTEHHGRGRTIFMGPKAQEIVRQFQRRDLQAHLFSPREARAEFVAGRRAQGIKTTGR
jgi:site-specific recombinase XerD